VLTGFHEFILFVFVQAVHSQSYPPVGYSISRSLNIHIAYLSSWSASTESRQLKWRKTQTVVPSASLSAGKFACF